ncbi:hypothetical protein D8B24_18770 [Verminephrobacter aporrectodeae subsp. tuberculatae]|nr:hypothetical protein [Verminephrobacter aporrectodeae subsp. tuberculatae]
MGNCWRCRCRAAARVAAKRRCTASSTAQHEAWRGLPERLDRPSLFVGHSLGAILAYEVARQWCAVAGASRPAPLLGLAVSACVAPRHWPTERGRALAQLDRAGLIEALRGYNGTPAEVFEGDDILALLLPTLEADFDLVASYSYGGRAALLALHGADDPHADATRVAGWADEAPGRLHPETAARRPLLFRSGRKRASSDSWPTSCWRPAVTKGQHHDQRDKGRRAVGRAHASRPL